MLLVDVQVVKNVPIQESSLQTKIYLTWTLYFTALELHDFYLMHIVFAVQLVF